MRHLSYTESKDKALRIIIILAIITLIEVLIALTGKGYLIEGVHFPTAVAGGAMIIGSFYKAYLVVFEFMHMKYEVPALMKTVLLPTFLLVWAIIAFLHEGSVWNSRRMDTTVIENRITPPNALKSSDFKVNHLNENRTPKHNGHDENNH